MRELGKEEKLGSPKDVAKRRSRETVYLNELNNCSSLVDSSSEEMADFIFKSAAKRANEARKRIYQSANPSLHDLLKQQKALEKQIEKARMELYSGLNFSVKPEVRGQKGYRVLFYFMTEVKPNFWKRSYMVVCHADDKNFARDLAERLDEIWQKKSTSP